MDSKSDMDRLGSLDPGSLTSAARQLYDDELEYFEGKLKYDYLWKLPNGRLVGPVHAFSIYASYTTSTDFCCQFGLELHSPGPGYAWLNMTKTLAEYTSLPTLAREVAILVTASHEQAVYAMYAHSAVSKLGKDKLDEIIYNKTCPKHLDKACQTTFVIATELASKPGPLAENIWEEGLKILGREATIAVIHYCGFYKYVATILNGFDAKLPEDKQW